MILTVTLNPSVDIKYTLNRFLIDAVNRVDEVIKTAGGKGLNVSRVLKQLGEEVGATGFLGGELGDFIRSELKKEGIYEWFLPIQGKTRNCIAILHEGMQTEILESGPTIQEHEIETFITHFAEIVPQVDIVTISGSLPKGVPQNFYQRLLNICAEHGKKVLLDINGKLLQTTLQGESKPYLIKPNEEELGQFFGRNTETSEEIIIAIQDDVFQGIDWVFVSRGSKGAIVKHHDAIYKVSIPVVKAVNPVGSGDSVIAGMAAGIIRDFEEETLIRYGMTMGVLNALEEKTGYINPERIDWCINEIRVERAI